MPHVQLLINKLVPMSIRSHAMTKNVHLGDSASLLRASQVALVLKDLRANAGN